jgi:hypothetical protein
MWEDGLIHLTRQYERIENVAVSSNAVTAEDARWDFEWTGSVRGALF